MSITVDEQKDKAWEYLTDLMDTNDPEVDWDLQLDLWLYDESESEEDREGHETFTLRELLERLR